MADGGATAAPAASARAALAAQRRAWAPATVAAALVALVVLAALALPFVLRALGLDFYLSFAGRIVVAAIAATSLNLILGYGGMVSFGHAAFVGLGAYTTAILVAEGQTSGWLHLAATVAVSALAALAIGAVSLRTRGVYFIMITLAFAQMLFYVANSAKGYGGDEGLTIRARSLFALGPWTLDLKEPLVFWYVALGVLAALLVALARFAPSRLGRALAAVRDDEVRAEALGFPTYRLKLAAFVAAGAIGGVVGLLDAGLQGYVSPNALHWTRSGTLMVMVILGGVGTLWGGVVGAAAFMLLHEVLSSLTVYADFWTGWVLLAVVLFARRGLAGLFEPRARTTAPRPSVVPSDPA